jgi:hypothetical protein
MQPATPEVSTCSTCGGVLEETPGGGLGCMSCLEQPENFNLLGAFALTNMGLGDKAAAFKFTEQAMAVMPIEKDAVSGPAPIQVLAAVAAQMGEPDRAIAALRKLLSIPVLTDTAAPLTSALLRLDPTFDPLRNDLRFQKLCEEKQH